MNFAKKTLIFIFISIIFSSSSFSKQKKENNPKNLTEKNGIEKFYESIVGISSVAVDNARSLATLGKERSGSGIVIDKEGHILTIGYLVIEADTIEITLANGDTYPGKVVGYDHATGFAILKSIVPKKLFPVDLGESEKIKENDVLYILPHLDEGPGSPTKLVSRRPFAGSWEYFLEKPIYTYPFNPHWQGTPLLNEKGQLLGIGSLFIRDSIAEGINSPGNLFVPIELLKPILKDLINEGKRKTKLNPWMGLTPDDSSGKISITRVSKDGPAEAAGIKAGDVLLSVNNKEVKTMQDFYKTAWSLGGPGTKIPINIQREDKNINLIINSIDRMDFFIKPKGF